VDSVETTGPSWRIGCAGVPDGMRRERYFENLTYVELDNTFHTLPKQKVLKRWAGPNHTYGVVAWQAITHPPQGGSYPRCNQSFDAETLPQAGSFKDSAFVRDAVTRLATSVTASGAETIVFRTDPSWTPSASNQQRLRTFFTEIATADRFGSCQRVWQPAGLWELPQAAALAADVGVLVACDPLPSDPLGPPMDFFADLAQRFEGRAYFRLTGLGQSRKLNEYKREVLLALMLQFQEGWLVFETPTKYHDARSVAKEIAGAA